jgi:glutathione S-transferase
MIARSADPSQCHLDFALSALRPPGYGSSWPTIVDDGFSLYESVAIAEYLDQRYPDSGSPLIPRDPKTAAITRRLVQEADHYFAAANGKLLRQTLFNRSGSPDLEEIADARDALGNELAHFERVIAGDYLAGPLSVADYTLYPWLALSYRIERQHPQHGVSDRIGPKILAWKQRIEALPYFEKTIPPHWKEGAPAK